MKLWPAAVIELPMLSDADWRVIRRPIGKPGPALAMRGWARTYYQHRGCAWPARQVIRGFTATVTAKALGPRVARSTTAWSCGSPAAHWIGSDGSGRPYFYTTKCLTVSIYS